MNLNRKAKRLRATIPTQGTGMYRILEALASGGKWTGMMFVLKCGVIDYRARICDLKHYGWPINATPVTRGGKRFNEYYMR